MSKSVVSHRGGSAKMWARLPMRFRKWKLKQQVIEVHCCHTAVGPNNVGVQ
ncbi:hypothetical protein KC19_VG175500 [Ceratodon purpureus]|uniref:Uncharacterized protein n=1 Tax=Ceratodon purpureus TaxID=3225 RepID=A0A8T0HQZ7_CERPU|nr:hypothetical protein KC19_VG175500 [Ceratodon purpureus]